MLIRYIFVLVYAAIGVELFCFLRHNQEIDSFNQNYQDLTHSIFSTQKFTFLESPIGQMKDTSQTLQPNFICFEIKNYEDFQKYGQNGCGNPIASLLFFLSYHIFYSLFLTPMFLAFIVDIYSDLKR